MSFNIDLILGVKTALNDSTQLYELLFEVVLNAPLKYCSIWESDIAHKTLMNHKIFADICHELHTEKNIPLLRENIMNGRISKMELNAFRDSRVKKLKKNWTLIAQEIIAKQEKNMHKKKNKIIRTAKNKNSGKKISKKKKKKKIDEDYIYRGGGKYKIKKHKKRQKKNKNMSNSKADKSKKRKQSENMDKLLKNKPMHKKRRLNTNPLEFFPILPLPLLVDNQSIVSEANDVNMSSHAIQKNVDQRSQILTDLEKMLFPDLPMNNNHQNRSLEDIEHAFIPVLPLLNSTLNVNNQQISLNELENNLDAGRNSNGKENDTKMDEQNSSKQHANQSENEESFIDMYKNVPLCVTLLRKQFCFICINV